MALSRKQLSALRGSHTLRSRTNKHTDARIQLRYELLEPRHLLAGDLLLDNASTSQPTSQANAPITWFERFENVSRVALESLATVDRPLAADVAGPQELATGEWIVQLTGEAVHEVLVLENAKHLLNAGNNNFEIIAGLGAQGMLLVRGSGVSQLDIEASLTSNANVKGFSLNQLIRGQNTPPNDTDFVRGAMPSFAQIGLPTAWDETIGSLSTIVGVLDTGIDLAHRDLYLNIWFNQGEIPTRFLDDVGNKLVDIDNDGLITFYDLNNATRSNVAPFLITFGGVSNGPNAEFVTDLNGNGYIDGLDILADPLWADGRDTDGNGEADDFFGVNFRGGEARNNPNDLQGHGTHVAGTIGAIGGNGSGVVGINWQTSLMSLRILDDNNQGDTGSAIAAVNYARNIRERYRVNDSGRVVQGANVRVLNNSWGQPGGYEPALETAIGESGDAGILFVAASGNGNFLGQGIDNDRTPFFPASYESPSVISVAASTFDDSLASFSNFGDQSVDLAAPGTGIRSTERGGGYGTRNGTSMAAPHVAGTAGLIWSALPDATLDEVSEAILASTEPVAILNGKVTTGGRLNTAQAINANVFAPSARVIAKQDITISGGTSTEFTVEYFHRSGIDPKTISDDDLVVARQWGPADEVYLTLIPGSVITIGNSIRAKYLVQAPGGNWDALDFGDYIISTNQAAVKSNDAQTIQRRVIGSFNIRIVDDPTILYVNTFDDISGSGSLRDAIIVANAAGAPRTIILDTGSYTIDIPHQPDPTSTFPNPNASSFCGVPVNATGWSNELTGDFDVTGSITIVGNQNDFTVIDAQALDRVFKVHPGAQLELQRLTVTGGVSPSDQGGGGILSAGDLTLLESIVRGNVAVGTSVSSEIGGGGIASWDGRVDVFQSWIDDNESNLGGGILVCSEVNISQSTISQNQGGGLESRSSVEGLVSNSTFSANIGGNGAISTLASVSYASGSPVSFSEDGRLMAFVSAADNLVPGDNNGVADVFVYDRVAETIERVSIGENRIQANFASSYPSISADGRFVAFLSLATNLVPGDTNEAADIFVYDRVGNTTKRASVADDGTQADSYSGRLSLSADGRFVAFLSDATNLVPGDTNSITDVFVYDRNSETIERVSVAADGTQANSISFLGFQNTPSLSADGRYVAFVSDASNLVLGDTNGIDDVFVFDRLDDTIERVSVASDGTQANFQSRIPSLSADGRFVSFLSAANNLVPNDTNGSFRNETFDVFVYDRDNDSIERVNLANDGTEANTRFLNGSNSSYASLSADGRFVAFDSDATNLIPFLFNTQGTNVYVYDRTNDTIEGVNLTSFGRFSNRSSFAPSLSPDGSFVAFTSAASDLVPRDTNGVSDLFVFERASDTTTIAPKLMQYLDASQLTVVGSLETTFAVNGNINLKDSLLFNPGILNTDSNVVSANLEQNPSPGIERFANLNRSGFDPPFHALLGGNPAIDAGSSEFASTIDQRGVLRSAMPDIGAVEAIDASLTGTVFVDLNNDQQRDLEEPALPNATIALRTMATEFRTVTDLIGSYALQSIDPGTVVASISVPPNFSLSTSEIQKTPPFGATDGQVYDAKLSADGRIVAFVSLASNLVAGDTNGAGDVFVYDRTSDIIERVSISTEGTQANSSSFSPSLSADGRFVAFVSAATNLVTGDTNGVVDIFVHDRVRSTTERVSIADDGTQANSFLVGDPTNGISGSYSPSISADGRFIAFSSAASNLVAGDTNNDQDIFVYDRQTDTIERVNVAADGTQASPLSVTTSILSPSISADGRSVAFVSSAGNLIASDTNAKADIFVFDLDGRTIERVNVASDGTQANEGFNNSFSSPSLSEDGRFVAFGSDASNLVPGDTNGIPDVFVFDREFKTIERVNLAGDGTQASGPSGLQSSPSLSADGRFVTFVSSASNLVSGDTNGFADVFVYDRHSDTIKRVSIAADGSETNNSNISSFSTLPSLSADGRFVAFTSRASNLVSNDPNSFDDVFVVANPFADLTQVRLTLNSGDEVTDLNFGLVPDPGTISGRLFDDNAILNGVYDIGENVLPGRIVFIDANGNGLLDKSEVTVETDSDGIYRFSNLPAFREHILRTNIPAGFEQVTPRTGNDTAFTVFLPAGRSLSEFDFGFRPIVSTGQSSDSIIRGRVMSDTNGNGIVDAGDLPVSGQVVYLDGGTLGVRDFNDPQTVTDGNGNYSFTGLPATLTPVRLIVNDPLVQVAPFGNDLLGNNSQPLKFPLSDKEKREGNPQSIVSGDFNDDGFADVAVVLAETNTLSIRLNDRSGGFNSQKLNFTLSEFATDLGAGNVFTQPISLVTAQLDSDPQPDFAIVGNFSSNVLVLRNFNSVTSTFGSKALLAVGQEPQDIVVGQFGGGPALDLVVLNKGSVSVAGDETVQVLTNDGSGVFSVGSPVVTGGKEPVSLAVGNFLGTGALDVAVTHAAPNTTNTTSGGVTLLTGNGAGGFSYDGNYFPVQATPLDSAVGDFNNDNRPDLAVVNFSSNSISIALGEADGTLRVQNESLGTATGAIDIAIADIDNDGDADVITTKLNQRQVSIFRNIGVDPTTGDVRFEPQENIGLGQFQFGERMPFVLANLDNDTSGPGGSGTLDIVAIPQNADTLYVLPNRLVQGSRRVSVSGASADIADAIDFLVRQVNINPTFNIESSQTPIFEDAEQQSVAITGIQKGLATGPELQFTVTSDNPSVISSPGVLTLSGETSTSFTYTAVANANGTAMLTVRAVDAGDDAVFGTDDDGVFERSFTVTVLAVNDPPTFSMPAETSVLQKAVGLTTVTGFVTGIGVGGGETGQTLEPFVVTASDTSFFTTQPAIDAAGTLTFAPNPNKAGVVPVTISLSDNGGRANGGSDTTTKSFVVNVLDVNDPPTFVLSPGFSVQADAGAQTHPAFANTFVPGGSDETGQVVSDYLVSVDTPGLFTVLPDIVNSGTLTFTPAIDRAGVATVSVQVRDSGGRANGGDDLSVVQTFTITVTSVPDTMRPTPVISYVGAALTNQTTFDVEVDFKEALAAGTFTIDDVTVSSGTKGPLVPLGDGKYRFSYTGSDGAVTFGVAANVATDLAGNPNLAAASVVRTIDSVGVKPTVTTTLAGPSNAASFPVVIAFGEAVNGFTQSDVSVVGGAVTAFAPDATVAGRYTLTVTPSAGVSGSVTVLVSGGAATDAAGNESLAADPLVRTFDFAAPTAKLTTNVPSQTNLQTFKVIAEFGEALSAAPAAASLSVTGGTTSAPVPVAGVVGAYEYTINAPANGTVTMRLVAGAVTDAAGNVSSASRDLIVVVDNTAFVPMLFSTAGARTSQAVETVALDFGKAVIGFTLSDVSLTNATASNLTTVDESSGNYTLAITAAADGPVNVLLAPGVVTDAAGNPNSPSNVLSWTLDRVAPIPTLTYLTGGIGQPVREIEVAFSEPVTGFAPTDLVVQGGTAGAIVRSRDSTFFNVLITPSGDGALTVELPAASVKDLAGLDNVAATSDTVTVDISRPVPTLSGAASATAGTFDITISFNESVTGLTSNDFQVTNATLSNLVGNGSSYAATLTAINVGELTITLPEERVTDGAGNRNDDSNVVTLVHNATQVQTSIVLTSAGETVDIATMDESLASTVTMIDIRGTGRNSLILSADKIATLTPNRTLLVIADQGDAIDFGDGWQFDSVEAVDGRLHRLFTNGEATVRVVGPLDWTNPVTVGDVNGSGDVTAGDALDILFSLNQPQLFNSQGMLIDAATVSASNFRFYDTNEDGTSTAADALFVINVLFLQSLASGEGESVDVQSALIASGGTDSKRDSESATDYSLDTETEVVAKFVKTQSVVEATKRVDPMSVDDADEDTGFLDDDLSGLDHTLAAVWDWIE